MSFKIGVLKKFANFTGKHRIGVSFLIKLQVVSQVVNLVKKETPTQIFSCELCNFFMNTFFTEYFRWLLLKKI